MVTIYEETQLLDFIPNSKLFAAVETILIKIRQAKRSDKNMYKNSIDPFSAIFDAASSGISLTDWLLVEKTRQVQKTLQNAVGEFHEEIIGSMPGWERLQVGHIIDVVNRDKKIIAELKNKHNTTKGSDKKVLYDNLQLELSLEEYADFTSYYVEIIPIKGRTYDKPFVPSDNTTKTKRPENPNIRLIDGRSFYAIASGDQNALLKLYKVLPKVIASTLNMPKISTYANEALFQTLFGKAFIED